MKSSLGLIFILLSSLKAITQVKDEYYLLVGTYTSGTKSEGIYVYTFNTKTGNASLISKASSVVDPSYLAVSPNERFVYAVNETNDNNKGGGVTAFSFDKNNGTLQKLNLQSSGGDHPCYVTVHKNGKWVLTGNYTSGSVAVLPVQDDGSLRAPLTSVAHQGSGPIKDRQEKPHVHATVFSPDGKFLFVPDLGIDKVMIYSFNSDNGLLTTAPFPSASVEPGSGPRHFVFHPNGKFAYLVEEMSGTVAVFSYANGQLQSLQRISALPKDFKGAIGSADIHVSPDGNFLYASNRGESNTIAIFKVNITTGQLSLIGHQSTMGKTPRNFNFDPSGNYLLVGNQQTNEVVIFSRNKKTGLLKDTGKRIAVPSPVCIKWIGNK